jgi:signal transduction histidine kinase
MKHKLIVVIITLVILGTAALHTNTYALSDKQTSLDNWEFYWMQLLSPDDIASSGVVPQSIKVPSSWGGQSLDGTALTSHGYATYRTIIRVDSEDNGKIKALYLPHIGSAYRVWVDGVLMEQVGVVGKKMEEETPRLQAKIVFIKPNHKDIEIVIQVSNFSFREGGILDQIQYGDTKVVISLTLKDILRDILMIGGFLFIGLYHLIIFGTRNNELSILLIGLGGIAAMIRTLFASEHIAGAIIPIQSWEVLVKVEYLSEIISYTLLFLLMKHLYPKEVHTTMLRVSYGVAICYGLYVLLTPARIYTDTILIQVSIMSVILLYFVGYVGIMAAIRQREGARLNLIALFIIVLATMNDTLLVTHLMDTIPLVEYSYANFIFVQAIIVSYRYSLLFNKNRVLASELSVMNRTLEVKVTDRTKELNEKNEQLGRMQQTRSRMLANIAHDLGSPIVGIQTYLQLMKDGIVQSGNQDVIQQLYGKSDDMRNLIEDLFELTKLESKAIAFDWREVEVKAFINEVFHRFELDLNNAGLTLKWGKLETADAGHEAIFRIEVSRLHRVIQNFMDNAVKFSRSAGSTITLSCYIVDEEPSHESVNHVPKVRIEVADQGDGIEPDELPFIFERFYKKQEGNEAGSGLGLAIAKEIVEQFGGVIGVESELGKGSMFYCTLPIYYVEM